MSIKHFKKLDMKTLLKQFTVKLFVLVALSGSIIFLTDSCKKPQHADTGNPTVNRLLSGTATATDSMKIRTGEIVMRPELFSEGRLIGFGTTTHTLAQAGFSASSAPLIWPRTAKRYGVPIDVNSMTVDWIAHQEMSYAMEDYAVTYAEGTPGKYYRFNHTWKLPQQPTSNGRYTVRKWIFNGRGAYYRAYPQNTTAMVLIDAYVKDQTDANSKLGNQYVLRDMSVVGNGNKTAGAIGIRLGAVSRPIFENIDVSNCAIGIDLQFCLEASLTNMNYSGYYVYGLAVRNGTWPGAAYANAQSNVVSIINNRWYNTTGSNAIASFYCNGNHTISGNLLGFEGGLDVQSHIFYENTGTMCVNVWELSNIYFEFARCTRAGIRIRTQKGQFIFNQFRSSIVESDMPCLVEVESLSTGSVNVFINNSTGNEVNKGKFRAIGNPSYGVNWYVTNYNMKNNSVFNSTDNFDLSMPGSYLPKSSDVRFVAPL